MRNANAQSSSSRPPKPKKQRKIHEGEALGLIPNLTPHPKKDTIRYQKGDLDVDTIIAYLTHLRETNDLPTEILHVRGRLRNAFPGMGCNKKIIKRAYEKAGWSNKDLCLLSKRVRKIKRKHGIEHDRCPHVVPVKTSKPKPEEVQ